MEISIVDVVLLLFAVLYLDSPSPVIEPSRRKPPHPMSAHWNALGTALQATAAAIDTTSGEVHVHVLRE